MQKTLNIVWKSFLVVLVAVTLVLSGYLYSNRDEMVTSNITMKYFVETVLSNDEDKIRTFVANSNNDVLYNNFVSTMNNIYYYEGVSDFEFEITNTELFGDGKYQCYFANAFENYTPKCDLENEGRYINYLVDIKVSYTFAGEKVERDEKGLVVFVKDMVDGNYFTWRLVRFDRYKVEAYEGNI